MNNCLCGDAYDGEPYCKIEEINNYSLATLDKDAYNWFMQHERDN